MKTLEGKLELAKKRKEFMEMEKKLKKMKEEMDFFTKHSAFRLEALQRNIRLYEMYNEEQRKNIAVRLIILFD